MLHGRAWDAIGPQRCRLPVAQLGFRELRAQAFHPPYTVFQAACMTRGPFLHLMVTTVFFLCLIDRNKPGVVPASFQPTPMLASSPVHGEKVRKRWREGSISEHLPLTTRRKMHECRRPTKQPRYQRNIQQVLKVLPNTPPVDTIKVAHDHQKKCLLVKSRSSGRSTSSIVSRQRASLGGRGWRPWPQPHDWTIRHGAH